MFKNKTQQGTNNICGVNVYRLRKEQQPKMSQRLLADQLQLRGIDVDKNAIQRIECGKRFVTDIELKQLALIFGVTCDALVSDENEKTRP